MPSNSHPNPLNWSVGTTPSVPAVPPLFERAWLLLQLLLLLLQSRRRSGRHPGFQCCFYGSSSHGLEASRAARCCSASVGESASRGDSRHLIMSPSEALAKLLTEDDHCFY